MPSSRILAVVLPCAFLAAPALAGMEDVKFDLSGLSQKDRNDIFQQATILGTVEAQFEYCGLRTEIVPRVTRAVEACVTTDSLTQVISEFRRSKSDMESSLQSEAVDCGDEKRLNWYRKTQAALDSYIENIARMCRNCLVC